MFLSYEYFKKKLEDKIVSGEDFYVQLLQTVIDNPNRYTGIFRVTNAKTKLVQNVTQSHEIKFGDFMEDIVTDYIALLGYTNLQKNIGADDNGDVLNTDQLFLDKSNNLYLVEQKIR
ncbi:MAG: restriction endonuclease, partial [Clostridiales bacterium]|nr:restriction endonuclease [Clostridiales bacterium]